MFAEGWLQVCHFLEVVNEARPHLTLEQGVGPQEICHHLILTDQTVPEEKE